jgi:hypothetical protein
MLLTLGEQADLDSLTHIVVVDNRSRDGGLPFLRALSEEVDRVHLVANRRFLSHGRGMRRGIGELDRIEADLHPDERANLLLFCDPDVIFLRQEVLLDLAASIAAHDGALVRELRRLHAYPDAQASFFVLRRDVYARRDIRPWVHHGSPAYWLQRSVWRAGLTVVDFPSNHGGHVLHRGRAGVAAAARHAPRHAYARVDSREPHFMGVPEGEQIWARVEAEHARLLSPDHEDALLAHLADRLEAPSR